MHHDGHISLLVRPGRSSQDFFLVGVDGVRRPYLPYDPRPDTGTVYPDLQLSEQFLGERADVCARDPLGMSQVDVMPAAAYDLEPGCLGDGLERNYVTTDIGRCQILRLSYRRGHGTSRPPRSRPARHL